jgi:ribonuclease HI
VTSYLVQLPSSLQGIRCYTDASTQPDVSQVIPRPAGIGIFIVNTEMQSPFSMFLKVAMQDSTSVIMAESAALALATSLCNTMDFHDAHFLSDNQMLVNCINGADPSNPRIGGLNLLLN